jgi:hypothetical protein
MGKLGGDGVSVGAGEARVLMVDAGVKRHNGLYRI